MGFQEGSGSRWGDHCGLGQVTRMASFVGTAWVQAGNRWPRPLPWGLFALLRDKGQEGPEQHSPTRASQGENSSGTPRQVSTLAN